jgi:glycogen debranching enzyme
MTANHKEVRGKELSVLTVMSRCLGKMSRWPAILKNVRECSYNAVHFAPFQKYGESFSHYSIADQTTIDDIYFESPSAIKPD